MATILSYGVITLEDILTKTFSQKPVFTEDGVTYLHDLYEIHVHALLNTTLSPSLGDEPPAAIYSRIKGCLSKPRQQLIYSENDVEIIRSPADGVVVDAQTGPEPISFNIVQVSPTTYLVEFAVKTWLSCPGDCNGDMTTPILSNRWTESQTIDETHSSKIVRKGRMVFRGDLLSQLPGIAVSADFYRSVILARCPRRPRMTRTSEYTIQSDGLIIEYQITDTEVYAVPLRPAVKFEEEYRVATHAGAVFTESVTVKVWGDNQTAKQDLYLVAAKIVSFRLTQFGFFVAKAGAGKAIKDGYFLEKGHQNYVEFHVELMVARVVDGRPDITLCGIGLGKATDPNFKFNPSPTGTGGSDAFANVPDPGVYGTLTIGILAAVLEDPCLNETILRSSSVQSNALTSVDSDNQPAAITVVATLPTDPTLFVGDSITGYDTVSMDINYESNLHTAQLPLACGSSTLCSFAVMAAPTITKTVEYRMASFAGQPILPATVSGDPNEILMYTQILPSMADLAPDGKVTKWTVAGRYVYGIQDTSAVKLYSGFPPYFNTNIADTEILSTQFVQGLTSSSGGRINAPVGLKNQHPSGAPFFNPSNILGGGGDVNLNNGQGLYGNQPTP
jgi:hypothetical protein